MILKIMINSGAPEYELVPNRYAFIKFPKVNTKITSAAVVPAFLSVLLHF